MAVMKASEFVAKLKDVAQNYKTLYVMGCFGAPLTGGNVSRYCNNHAYNKQAARTKMIKAAANQNPPVFGFDCVCLIKGILWGWRGDASKTYGGASYAVNGVPDIGADTMITKCKGVSTNFSNVEVGEALWCSGHIGVYIGGGLAVECSPAFENDVQITAVKNMGTKSGYNARTWTKHGKLPYIEYDNAAPVQPDKPDTGAGAGGAIKAGSVVRVKQGAKTYTGGGLASFVYERDHVVSELNGDRAVITYGGVTVAAVRVSDLVLADGSGAGGAIKAGSVVRVKQGAKTYTGGGLASFVYERDHVVSELNGDRAVITYGGVTVAAVRVSDLVLADGSGAGGTIKAGSVVRVKQGAKTYTGGGLASFVYSRDHVVSELNGDRAVITYGGVTVAAVRVSDLVLADGSGAGGTIKAGSVVRVKQGAKTYTGGGLASFVYSRDHVVSELNGDRAVITYGGVTVAAVRVSDLTLVKE